MRKSRKAEKRAAAVAVVAAARISCKAEGRARCYRSSDTKAARTKSTKSTNSNGRTSHECRSQRHRRQRDSRSSNVSRRLCFWQRSFLRLGRVISLAFAGRVGWLGSVGSLNFFSPCCYSVALQLSDCAAATAATTLKLSVTLNL